MQQGKDPRRGVDAPTVARFNDRELAAVLAGLRLLQAIGPDRTRRRRAIDVEGIGDVATDGGGLRPLDAAEIDALCERINVRGSESAAEPHELAVDLEDQGTDRDPDLTQRAKVVATPYSIDVAFDGYGGPQDAPNGWPVSCEIYEGRLQVVVWADINAEDPTHVIDLSGAAHQRLGRQ